MFDDLKKNVKSEIDAEMKEKTVKRFAEEMAKRGFEVQIKDPVHVDTFYTPTTPMVKETIGRSINQLGDMTEKERKNVDKAHEELANSLMKDIGFKVIHEIAGW